MGGVNMLRFLLATGSVELDKSIQEKMKCVKYVGTVYSSEKLYECIEVLKPDVIFLTEIFDSPNIDQIIVKIKRISPDIRVIYTSLEYKNSELLSELKIYDIFHGEFTITQLEDLIN